MASVGQTRVQRVQPMHEVSMYAFGRTGMPSSMAPVGHSVAQRPQFMHFSGLILAR